MHFPQPAKIIYYLSLNLALAICLKPLHDVYRVTSLYSPFCFQKEMKILLQS